MNTVKDTMNNEFQCRIRANQDFLYFQIPESLNLDIERKLSVAVLEEGG